MSKIRRSCSIVLSLSLIALAGAGCSRQSANSKKEDSELGQNPSPALVTVDEKKEARNAERAKLLGDAEARRRDAMKEIERLKTNHP